MQFIRNTVARLGMPWEAAQWRKAWEGALEFGHCLWAGMFAGAPSVVTSNRAGGRDLLLLRWERRKRGSETLVDPERIVVDAGVGAANMLVVQSGGAELLFATNQAAGEIVCYRRSM
jgi:hypothetical protein